MIPNIKDKIVFRGVSSLFNGIGHIKHYLNIAKYNIDFGTVLKRDSIDDQGYDFFCSARVVQD